MPPPAAPTETLSNERNRRSEILAAACLTAGLRFLVALSRLDDGSFQYYTGNIAWAVLQGLPLEARELPLISHNRGSMVVGFLAVPFVALLGPSLLAIKLLAVAMSSATAALFVGILGRHQGSVAAWVGALLYAFLPPSFQMLDVMPQGSHVDSLVFTFAALSIVLGWREALPRARHVFAFGLVCGFGLFFSFHFLLVLPILAACWWRVDPGWLHRPRRLVPFAFAFGLAFSPFVLFLPDLAEATDVVRRPLAERLLSPENAAEKLWNELALSASSFWMFAPTGVPWAGSVYGLSLAAGLCVCVARFVSGRCRDASALFFIVYPGLLVLAYSITDFHADPDVVMSGMDARYLAPAMPCMAAWVAIGAQALFDRKQPRLAVGLAAGAVLAGAAGTFGSIDLDVARDQPAVKGTKFAYFKRHIPRAAKRDGAAMLEWIDRLDGDWAAFRPLHYRNFHVGKSTGKGPTAIAANVAQACAADEQLRPFLLVDVGRQIAEQKSAAIWLREAMQIADGESTCWILRGVGQTCWYEARAHQASRPRHADEWPLLDSLLDWLPEDHALLLLEGAGFSFGHFASPYSPDALEIKERMPDLAGADRDAFYVGAGWGYRMRYFEADYEPPVRLKFESLLPQSGRAAFRRGLAWGPTP